MVLLFGGVFTDRFSRTVRHTVANIATLSRLYTELTIFSCSFFRYSFSFIFIFDVQHGGSLQCQQGDVMGNWRKTVGEIFGEGEDEKGTAVRSTYTAISSVTVFFLRIMCRFPFRSFFLSLFFPFSPFFPSFSLFLVFFFIS